MIQVLGDRVLVALRPSEGEITTDSGLVLMRDPDRFKAPTQGIVVQIGEKSSVVDIDDVLALISEHDDPDIALDELKGAIKRLGPAPFDVTVGDCVLFASGAGEQIELDDVQYVILREDELIGTVDQKEHAA